MDRSAPEMTTARLLIRLVSAADAPRMLEFAIRNRAHLESTSPTRTADYFTPEFWEQRTTIAAADFERGTAASLVLLDRTEVTRTIGTVGLSMVQRGPLQAANLGYALDKSAQGCGYMHEALNAVVGHAFGPMNLHRLFAGYMPTNDRSGRVLRKLGFEVIGYCRDYLHIAGAWRDHILTSLVNANWRPE